jgi:uncharacterized protein (DUF433 family)
MEWQDHITVDPQVCHSKACIAGTRVMVSVVLDNLAAGESPDDIASGYGVTREDVQAALLCAAELGLTESDAIVRGWSSRHGSSGPRGANRTFRDD